MYVEVTFALAVKVPVPRQLVSGELNEPVNVGELSTPARFTSSLPETVPPETVNTPTVAEEPCAVLTLWLRKVKVPLGGAAKVAGSCFLAMPAPLAKSKVWVTIK